MEEWVNEECVNQWIRDDERMSERVTEGMT